MLNLIAALVIALAPQEGRQSLSPEEAGTARALFTQTYTHWHVPCDTPGAKVIRVVIDVELDGAGLFTRDPVLVRPQDTPAYRAAAASALKALRDTEPFDVPEGFTGGQYRPIFRLDRVCRNDR